MILVFRTDPDLRSVLFVHYGLDPHARVVRHNPLISRLNVATSASVRIAIRF